MMGVHGMGIAFIIYIALLYIMKQPQIVAEKNAVLAGAISTIYMIVFGHKLPTV